MHPRGVFITGASDGIGAALARAYAARSVPVGLVARRRDRVESLAASLGTRAIAYAADVRDSASLRNAAEDFVARHGVPDIVIANAGVSAGNLTGMADDIETCEWIFDVNVTGMIRTFQPFIERMTREGRGSLVGIASVAGVRGLPGAGAYCASKSAMITYLESLRVELRPSGVRVLTICPGYVATAMTVRNPYPMPFMLPVDEAARRIVRAVDAGRRYTVIPWQMGLVARALRLLPRAVFDRVFVRAGRKPRRTDKTANLPGGTKGPAP
ncbi:MAG: SDR family oxidoreductase [Burkholderiales bacterium]